MNKELRQKVCEKYKYKCSQCNELATDIHHIVPQRKYNIKIYGADRIESESNMYPVCRAHHNNHNQWDKEIKRKLLNQWNQKLKT